MSALDHLAYQIVCSDTGDRPPNPNWIYFPIADSAEKYEAKKRGKIEGVRQETFEAIDALKPYKGGNDPIWALYRLNNIEKHLLITVGSANVRFPLEAGDQLFIDAPDAEPNQNLQFRFNVALYEPQIIEAQSLLEKVHELTTLVERIVAALTPRLQ